MPPPSKLPWILSLGNGSHFLKKLTILNNNFIQSDIGLERGIGSNYELQSKKIGPQLGNKIRAEAKHTKSHE